MATTACVSFQLCSKSADEDEETAFCVDLPELALYCSLPRWGPTWQLTSEAKDQKGSTFLGVLSNVQLTLQDDLRFFPGRGVGVVWRPQCIPEAEDQQFSDLSVRK